jgi:putative DNA primase/helicase
VFAFAFKTLNAQGITGLVNLARGIDGIPLDHEALDADGWLLGVENGVVELRTGKFREADPTDLMTMRCPVPWDENASAHRWEQALEEWFPDAEVRAYVQRVAGSALVGAQRDHVFVIHYGLGANGKGTFMRALQHVLGPHTVEIHLSLLVETRYKEHDTVRADLFRTRLAVAVETDRRVRLAEASVKNLTGGDRIRARRMREDPWSFDPSHSLWLQTNHLPEIGGRDAGIWRRIRVVKWVAQFMGDNADPGLDDTLAAEAPGILRWLVEGCLEWQDHGLAEPEAVIRDTLEYRSREDVFARFATDTGLAFRHDLEIQAQALQDLLTDWAATEGQARPDGLTDWLEENGARKTQKRVTGPDGTQKRPKFWVGVGIEGAGHETEQTNAL